MKFILMDIEGTISDISFVKDVLFPYSARELRNYVASHKNDPTVRDCLRGTEQPSDEAAILQLLTWIRDDVKHPSLKTLQGLIWKRGFQKNEFKAHLYPDVIPAWKKWQSQGYRLGIYSSGSVQAQHLYFQYSTEGDVREFLEAYFDLAIGSKRDPKSYIKIAQELQIPPQDILFLSDVVEELDAAKAAEYKTALIVRGKPSSSGTPPSGTNSVAAHPHYSNLAEI